MPPTLTTKSSLDTEKPNKPEFHIVTKALGGTTGDNGRRRFNATASSTITDRQGDKISLKALQQMRDKFREGITIFTDHDNKVANAFGTTDWAEIVEGGTDAKGDRIWDLKIAGGVNEPYPSAVQLHDSISGGYVKLGCSIDAFVTDHKPNVEKSGRYDIDGLDVFAASIVGVPANQRSWTQKAVRAIKSFYGEPEEEDMPPEMTVAESDALNGTETVAVLENPSNTVVINKADDNISDNILRTVTEAPVAELDPAAELAELQAELEITKAPDDPEAIKASGCPDCGKGHDDGGDCSNSYHSTAKAVDGEGGQESSLETPETAPIVTAEAEPLDEKAAGVPTEDVNALLGHVERLVKEINGLREENQRLTDENDRLIKANTAVHDEVELAKQVIGKVLEQPLRSQTSAYVQTFTKAHELFDPDIADYLAKRGN